MIFHQFIKYSIVSFLLIFLILGYFRIAEHFKIVDHPNDRSSHDYLTIRGGGIIFPISTLIYFFVNHFQFPIFFIGLFIVCVISFIDDIFMLPKGIRVIFQAISLLLLFYQARVLGSSTILIILIFIYSIALLNAYNFMDGINGITGLYSLSILVSYIYLNSKFHFFTYDIFIFLLIAIIIFLFFNGRKKALCFAGDVGSISIAYILCFACLFFSFRLNNFIFLLFFSVYGVETSLTIIHRFLKGENIFKAHRSHVYQYMVNELKMNHLLVSLIYGIVQLFINIIIILTLNKSFSFLIVEAFIIIVVLSIIHTLVRNFILKHPKYSL